MMLIYKCLYCVPLCLLWLIHQDTIYRRQVNCLSSSTFNLHKHSLASQSCDDCLTSFPHSHRINARFILHIDMLWNIMIFFVFTYFQIPAAPVALIDFSSAKSKKQKLDCSTDGRTTAQKVWKSLLCPRVTRESETYASFF